MTPSIIMIEKSTDGNSYMIPMTDWAYALSRATLFTAPPAR